MALSVNGTTVVTTDRAFTLGTATPGSPATGMIRWNSSSSQFEVYNGTAWTNLRQTVTVVNAAAWTWGKNNYGQLGLNIRLDAGFNEIHRSSPSSVVGGLSDWTQIEAGTATTMALRANGTIWGWGTGTSAIIGDNTNISRSSPVSIVGGFTDWIEVSTTNRHTLAIRANGTAWGWGQNYFGRLGDGTTIYRSSPVSVVGGFTDWVQIATGWEGSAGLRANGTAWGWGFNGSGRLGDGTYTNRSSPVSVVGGISNWSKISRRANHVLAIRANGQLWAWGTGHLGKLGNGSTNDVTSPSSVLGGFTDWIQISAGYMHSLAIRSNGTAWAWGQNRYSQLGINNNVDASYTSPRSIVGGFTDWVQVSAGEKHSLGIRANGTAWGWGYTNNGRVGNNSSSFSTSTGVSSPVSVVGGFTDWVQISAGGSHSAGLRAI